MDASPILKNVSRHIDLDTAEEQFFVSLLREKEFEKKAFVLREQEIGRDSIFVTRGCLRAYTIDHEGMEHVLQFAPPGWWIADMYSLISGKPGSLNIDAVEDATVLLLSREKQESLFARVPKFERFFRIITENSLVASRQRVLDNLSLSARERFADFCHQFPSLADCVPQKMIASYLGITPEFFSKIKSEYFRQKGPKSGP